MTDLLVEKTVIRADAKPPVGRTPTVVEETPNVKLLQETLEYIKAFPQTWRQEDWFVIKNPETQELVPHLVEIEYTEVNSCGSAMCFAGHAALKEGFPAPPKFSTMQWGRDVDGENYPEDVEAFAAKRLGLSHTVASELFAPENTLETLEKMVEAIIENPGITYWDLESIREEVQGSWNDDEEDEEEEDEEIAW